MRPFAIVTATVLLLPCSLTLGAAQTVTNAVAGREPAAVPAAFDLVWAGVVRFVRGDMTHDRLLIVEESAGFKRGRWGITIPSEDFRAANWASCQSGTEPPIAPRGGIVDVVVRGDSAAATVLVTVTWSALGRDESQRAMQCRTLGEYEKEAEKAIRRHAERAARR